MWVLYLLELEEEVGGCGVLGRTVVVFSWVRELRDGNESSNSVPLLRAEQGSLLIHCLATANLVFLSMWVRIPAAHCNT